MLVLQNNRREFQGIVGFPSGSFIGDTEVCIGDTVSVSPENGVHHLREGVVGIFNDTIAVMGLASTPISRLKLLGIVKSHTRLKHRDRLDEQNYFLVTELKR